MIKEIKIPEISENVESGLIASILVSKGDRVSTDQALVEVETDKATTEIPSEYDGEIKEIKVEEGDEVTVNKVIMTIEVDEDTNENKKNDKADKDTENNTDELKEEEKDDDNRKDEVEKNIQDDQKSNDGKKEEKHTDSKKESDQGDQLPASPLARKIARENNLDLSKIKPSGPGNRISRGDIEKYLKENDQKDSKENNEKSEEYSSKESLNNIGRITAKNMQEAWQKIPHVTQFDEADITELEEFRKKNQGKIEEKGGKLTITAILLKVTAYALQKYPKFNSTLDWQNQTINYKKNYHIGVAVDTQQGLLVPVVRNVNQKSLGEISTELTELAQKARDKKLSTEDMQGGTFTVSNLGGIGGKGFTPIVYPPQVAILGVSSAEFKPRYLDDEPEKRLILPLCVSYDHRVINGADGARFLKWLCQVLKDPYALLF